MTRRSAPRACAFAAILSAGSIGFIANAWAVPTLLDGNRLYDACSGIDKEPCESYIAGVIDAWNLAVAQEKAKPAYCLPDMIDIDQLRHIVTDFLRRQPYDRAYSAASLVVNAIGEVFPCAGAPD